MKTEITYQNDSLRRKLPVEDIFNLPGAGELRIDRSTPLPLDTFRVRRKRVIPQPALKQGNPRQPNYGTGGGKEKKIFLWVIHVMLSQGLPKS